MVWVPVWFAGATAQASLVTHAAAGFGGATLQGPDNYGAGYALAETGYAGAWIRSEAWSAYGIVGTRVSVAAAPALYDVNRALAEAAFSDRLRINGPIGSGFIVYRFSVEGHAEGEADAHLFLRHGSDPDEEVAGEVTETGVFDSKPHAVVFGQEFPVRLSMLTLAVMELGESGLAAADFSAGAALTGIDVFDGQMNPIGGWSIGSESGTSYPVPAPAAAWLLAGGLAARRKRRTLTEGTLE